MREFNVNSNCKFISFFCNLIFNILEISLLPRNLSLSNIMSCKHNYCYNLKNLIASHDITFVSLYTIEFCIFCFFSIKIHLHPLFKQILLFLNIFIIINIFIVQISYFNFK